MKIEFMEQRSGSSLTIQLSHGDKKSEWDVQAYARTSAHAAVLESNKVFEEINGFWEWLPENRQLQIWKTYEQIHQAFDNSQDHHATQSKLLGLVKQLYDLMPLNEFRHWVNIHSRVHIPNSLPTELQPDLLEEGTYLRSDYKELVILAVALRPMVPIWGQFIGATKSITANVDKEYRAMELLFYSWLVRCEPMERLRIYIEAQVKRSLQQGPTPTAILGGLGSTELPDWVLALTLVRRLSVGIVSSPDDGPNIVTNMFQFIGNNLKSMDRKYGGTFGGKVNEKNVPASNASDDNKPSIVEMYKVKQEVSDGDLVTLNVYTEQVYEMAMKVEPLLDPNRLEACLRCVKAMEQLDPQQHQIVLVQWVMAPVIPPRGVPSLTKTSLLRVMAVTQAVLWQWEFYDLAALVTAEPLRTANNEMYIDAPTRGKIPKELMEQLQIAYPYYPVPRQRTTNIRNHNVAARAIEAVTNMVMASEWQLHGPTELVELTSRRPNTKKLSAPPDTRVQLAKLILQKIAR